MKSERIYLGVDYGSARVGFAVAEAGLARPVETLPRGGGQGPVERACKLVSEHGASTIVVGLPLRLDGTRGDAARRAESFAAALRAAVPEGATVVLMDERFSSTQAEQSLDAAGVRGARRRDVVDQVAAALILQAYVDAEQRDQKDTESWQSMDPESIDALNRIAETQRSAQTGGPGKGTNSKGGKARRTGKAVRSEKKGRRGR